VSSLSSFRVAAADAPRDTPSAIDVDRDAAPPGRIEFGFDSGAPLAGWGASLATRLVDRPITLTGDDGVATHPVRRRETLVVGGALALGSSVVIDARLPIAHQIGDRLAATGDATALDRYVAGDIRAGARIHVAGDSPSVFVRGELSLPSGDDSNFAGEASWSLAWSLIGRAAFADRVVAAVSGGVRLRGAEVLVGDRVVGNELFGSFGVAVAIPPIRPLWCVDDQVRLTAELTGIVGDKVAGKVGPSPATASIGIVTQPLPDLAFGLRVGAGLDDQIGSPRAFAMLELAYRGSGSLIPAIAVEPDDE
jgi:hypothetical protein